MSDLRVSVFVILIFISAHVAVAFEVEGFRSGMSKAAVLEKANSWAKVSERDRDTVLVSDSFGNYLSFNFCKDKLVSMQRSYKPSLQ
jgi:hypothetical protein